jgi:DNA-binding NtrC family response regulator
VLIVDDEPLLLRALERILRRSPVAVETAASAEEALEVLASREFALVISDLGLPGLNGHQLLERVGEAWPRTQRLLLTGQRREPGWVEGEFPYPVLAKPCEPELLRRFTEDALR